MGFSLFTHKTGRVCKKASRKVKFVLFSLFEIKAQKLDEAENDEKNKKAFKKE